MKRRDFLTISLMGFGALLVPSQVQGMTSGMSLKSFAGRAPGSAADPLLWKGLANLGHSIPFWVSSRTWTRFMPR